MFTPEARGHFRHVAFLVTFPPYLDSYSLSAPPYPPSPLSLEWHCSVTWEREHGKYIVANILRIFLHDLNAKFICANVAEQRTAGTKCTPPLPPHLCCWHLWCHLDSHVTRVSLLPGNTEELFVLGVLNCHHGVTSLLLYFVLSPKRNVLIFLVIIYILSFWTIYHSNMGPLQPVL